MRSADITNNADDARTSLTLVGRAVRRDPAAWERLVRIYTPLVFHWTVRAGLQNADAADVVQDVFQVLAKKLPAYDPDKGAGFRAWLAGIARKKVAEFLRKRAAGPRATGGTEALRLAEQLPGEPDDETWRSIEQSGAGKLLHAALRIVREETQPRTWRAFWGMTVEGRSAEELAGELGLTRRAVRQAKYRVLQRLRDLLGGDADALGLVSGPLDDPDEENRAAAWRSGQ